MRKAQKDRNSKKEERAVNTQVTEFDYTFLFIVLATLCFGLVMLLSASTPAAKASFDNSYHFFSKQIIFAVIGLTGMFIISRIDYHIYAKYITQAMVICVGLLVAVAIPSIGVSVNGSRRWLQLPGFQLQPSEFMKPAVAVYFAYLVIGGKYDLHKIKQLWPFGAVLAVVSVLMLLEPHLSGMIVIVSIGVAVLVAAGARLGPFFVGAAVGLPAMVAAVYFFSPIRWARIATFLDPFSDMQKTGYQITQSLYAIGSGGIFGKGLGRSIQKYSYLPEPYNDFIFSVICEELGLIGAICVIVLFAFLIMRALRIALDAPDTFGSLIGVGISAQVGIQTILNIAVATSSMPNTGVSLPFFSYGGTAIMVLLMEMGILLNISRQTNTLRKRELLR